MPNLENTQKRIVFIITGLNTGGAEMMLYKLLSSLDRQKIDPVVISLTDRGALGDRISALGIQVHTIGMKTALPTPLDFWRLIYLIRQLKPDLIQGWLYHANIAAQIVTAFTYPQVPVLWNIRCSVLGNEKLTTTLITWLGARLSRFPRRIINNAQNSAIEHQAIGYFSERTCIIPNGFNTECFIPSLEAYRQFRLDLGIPETTILIGIIARYHPMKDHANFIKAAELLLKKHPDIHFILVGKEVDWQNQQLFDIIHQLKIIKNIYLLGERQDIPYITAALDIASSSSSYGEGFPNTIGEAMSCGVPCVVTDVGDSAWIVGDTGRVVPPRNAEALYNGWLELIEMGDIARRGLGIKARQRIKENFSLESIVQKYQQIYEEVFNERKH